METLRIRPLTEGDLDSIIEDAGGTRAVTSHSARDPRNADYLLDGTALELKLIEEDGLAKQTRQAKVAELFAEGQPDRDVVILDHELLSISGRKQYDRILEGPVKNAISTANKQLKQTRLDKPETHSSVLLLINNGYTALDHQLLLDIAERRVRNDTHHIDGLVVAGCYYFSDSFDSYFLWPIDYVAIRDTCCSNAYDALRASWNEFSQPFVTQMLFESPDEESTKGPVIDVEFEHKGITYVKPAPRIGRNSDFFIHGRPRLDSSGLDHCPPVARTFPDISVQEWAKFRETLGAGAGLAPSHAAWIEERSRCAADSDPLQPFIPIQVSHSDWLKWLDERSRPQHASTISEYANAVFDTRVRALMDLAKERTPTGLIPSRYVLVTTKEIGQDRANDLSTIAVVRESGFVDAHARQLLKDARIFHEHALALGCAYALLESASCVLWEKDLKYAWT
ncbi:MAG: hypothetical protein ED559_06210 [Phycisphaera sp.]|nr:MAG: hypothetical protein ED559_06210 [Phycisphaera sp.]